MSRPRGRVLAPALGAGFGFGNAFAHWALRNFDASAWCGLASGVCLGMVLLGSALGDRRTVCGSRLHRDFTDRDVRCELPEGHFWHRNGERTWTP